MTRKACQTALLLFLLTNSALVSAQKEFSIWMFGTHNGIDFRSGSPVPFYNPNFSNPETEGTTSISDANGNLLFYSDGENVFNSKHDTYAGCRQSGIRLYVAGWIKGQRIFRKGDALILGSQLPAIYTYTWEE